MKENIKIALKEMFLIAIITISISAVIMSFVRVINVNGVSMENTLYNGQKLILDLKAYKNKEAEYKDIVVIKRDDLEVKHIIKRVIGTPGDKIVIKNNELYINDKLIEEDYIKEKMNTADLEIVIPEGKLFVMGDNRNNSLDSRNLAIGLIDNEDVLGKIVFSISTFKVIN